MCGWATVETGSKHAAHSAVGVQSVNAGARVSWHAAWAVRWTIFARVASCDISHRKLAFRSLDVAAARKRWQKASTQRFCCVHFFDSGGLVASTPRPKLAPTSRPFCSEAPAGCARVSCST